jgi:aspartate-semialdehyde dehydrogenase
VEGGAFAVAVVGASGLVGREIVTLFEERQFPVGELSLLGSLRTAGQTFEDEGHAPRKIELLGPNSFANVDIAFFAAGPRVAGEFVPIATAAGATVIDCSSRYRLDDAVPLVVPEVNPESIGGRHERGIIANPSSTSIALSVVLAPLAVEAGLSRVIVSTYQGVATAGQRAMNGLSRETVDLLNTRGPRRTRFARRIAFNCIPQVGAVEPGGSTTHELMVTEETRKILGDPALALQVTAVRVPVFFGSAMSVVVETQQPLDAAGATDILRAARGIQLHDAPGGPYPTPAEVVGSAATHVGRIRDDPSTPQGIALWVAFDNVRKGAALNAVETAEILVREFL